MIRIYLYDKESRYYAGSFFGDYSEVIKDIPLDLDFTLTPPPNKPNAKFKWVEPGQWEIEDIIYIPHIPPKENRQNAVWDGIKAERLKQITSGVYVPSVDKVFHTDDVSVIQYNNIGNMIALGNFEPIQWKVMDNTWITLSEEVFKELQTVMVQNTNRIYQVAEEHKANMMELDNPEEYDYSTGWEI